MSTVFFLFVNNVNSVNSVNIVNSYSAVLPPSPMVFFVLELLSIVINATRETFPALSSKCLDLFVLQSGLIFVSLIWSCAHGPLSDLGSL